MTTIRIGLTGMSRAGKTVFLTSAIHNFTQHDGSQLDEFEQTGWRYDGNPVPLVHSESEFPYQKHLDGLRQTAVTWPAATRQVSEFAIELHLVSRGTARKKRECLLEFVDYPGERLVDVLLLNRRWDDWAEETWVATESVESAQAFRAQVQQLLERGDAGIEELFPAVQQAFGKYQQAELQANRPVAAPVGPVLETADGQPVEPPFFPIPSSAWNSHPSLVRRLRLAYDRYVNKDVFPFFQQIASCDQQIVLVDILDILQRGSKRHRDVQQQLHGVLHAFRCLQLGPLRRNFGWLVGLQRRSLHRVQFCATKADQATFDDRSHLASLLKQLVLKAHAALNYSNDLPFVSDYCCISALRTTIDLEVSTEAHPTPFQVIRGRLKQKPQDLSDKAIFPGRVPDQWPTEDDWLRFQCPDFVPRKIPSINGPPLAHLGMDVVMYRMIEEVLK